MTDQLAKLRDVQNDIWNLAVSNDSIKNRYIGHLEATVRLLLIYNNKEIDNVTDAGLDFLKRMNERVMDGMTR